MRILGGMLAGGMASRFGSDKALAELDGKALIDHVIAALAPYVTQVAICGRSHGDHLALADRPARDLGPLGGLAAALHHAASHGFDAVLTAGCDTPLLPPDLFSSLITQGPPAIIASLPICGFWPATLAPLLDAHLAGGGNRSLRRWADVSGAIPLELAEPIANVNTPGDLAAIIAQPGR